MYPRVAGASTLSVAVRWSWLYLAGPARSPNIRQRANVSKDAVGAQTCQQAVLYVCVGERSNTYGADQCLHGVLSSSSEVQRGPMGGRRPQLNCK